MDKVTKPLQKAWQLSLRRFLIEQAPSNLFAWSFGIDMPGFRQWMELLFKEGMTWENNGQVWEIDHIIPLEYFEYSRHDMMLYWGFLNTQPVFIKRVKNFDVEKAKEYFIKLELSVTKDYTRAYLDLLFAINKTEKPLPVIDRSLAQFLLENKRTIGFMKTAGYHSDEYGIIYEKYYLNAV